MRRKPKRQRGVDPGPDTHLPMRFFREAAEKQKLCRAPGCPNKYATWSAHHVVYRQHLRTYGLDQWDARDALRLCGICHAAHHARTKVLPVRALTAKNLEFVFEVLQGEAIVYLRRYYTDATIDDDPRLSAFLEADA
jgi:hypothetical protein